MEWNPDMARRLRESGENWDKIGHVFGVTADTVKIRLDPEYAQRRRDRNNERRKRERERNSVLNFKERRLQECREMSAAKKAGGFRYAEGARSWQAEIGWRKQIEIMPEDRRSVTASIFGDPIAGDPRCPWRPSSRSTQHGDSSQ